MARESRGSWALALNMPESMSHVAWVARTHAAKSCA